MTDEFRFSKKAIQFLSPLKKPQLYLTHNIEVIHTLYNVILRIARNFLETRENIKISTHPFYHINFHGNEAKKIQNGQLKKTEFFRIANSQNFSVKILWIGPCVSRIE